ncbi:MAG: site-2 protease family protein [Actinomycetes bacterium]
MFPRAIRILSIRGIDVRVDPSWILIALLVVWSFQLRFSAGQPTAVALVMAVVAALLFFASVLAHEAAHALEGQHRDAEVGGITLFLFGGVTEMHAEPERPRDEFAIAAIGPWVSLVLGALFGLVAALGDAFGAPAPVGEVAGVLGWLNVALAVFNIIPGAPLDGGRVLRAIAWAITKDRQKAIRIAAHAGAGVAGLILLYAFWTITTRPGALLSALWLSFIGWYILRAARAELAHSQVSGLLGGRTVAALVVVPAPRIPKDRALDAAADAMAAAPGFAAFPVVDASVHPDADLAGADVLGALRLEDVRRMDPHDRAVRFAGDVMVPVDDLPTVRLDTEVLELLRLVQGGAGVVAVVGEDDRVRTVLGQRQVFDALERLHQLARRTQRTGRGRAGGPPPPPAGSLPPPAPGTRTADPTVPISGAAGDEDR